MEVSRTLGIIICSICMWTLSLAQEVDSKQISIDLSGGIASSDFFSLSPTAGVNVLLDIGSRFQTGLSYEHYFHETLIGITSPSTQILTDYSYGYTVGLNAGYDLLVRQKVRLGLVARPTFSQVGGTISTIFFNNGSVSSISERDFRTSRSIGIGLQLRGEYLITDQYFGLVQLGGHEDFGQDLSRIFFRVGVGVRL